MHTITVEIVSDLNSFSLAFVFLTESKPRLPINHGNNQAESPKIPNKLCAVKVPNLPRIRVESDCGET